MSLSYLYKFFRLLNYIQALIYDKRQAVDNSLKPKFFNHESGKKYILDNFDKPGFRVLEIGSREVTGKNILRTQFKNAEYVGFDIYPGNNVDVVGDAHNLSKFFDKNTFDLVYSSAVFEHLALPWVVAEEISTILKLGGEVCIETHFSYRLHERPWNFFQFSDVGLISLFNKKLGFDVLDSGLDLPLIARFSIVDNPKYLRLKEVGDMYSHSYFVGKKIKDIHEKINWHDVTIEDILPGSRYPFSHK